MKDSSVRLIEGRNPIVEAFKAGTQIHQLYFEQGLKSDAKISFIKRQAAKQNIPTKKVARKVLERMSRTGVHQGVVCRAASLATYSLLSIIRFCEEKKKQPFFVLVTEVLYQYNLGALLRTSLAAGVDAVIVPKNTKEPGAVVSRASMGAVERVPLVFDNIYSALKILKDHGIKIVAADEKSNKKYYDASLRLPLALLVGGEDSGISRTMLKRADESVMIPMSPSTHSLNLSVAAGLLLYEVKRQNDR
jgi:23S rRNA (guanosine2251-2'-O)-methyltransferase